MNIRVSAIKVLSTFLYIGYLPFIPGTFASIAAVFLFYLNRNNTFFHMLLTLVLLILGFLVGGEAERVFNKKDSPRIVIDEVSGMLLAFLLIPYDIKLVVIGFILFRLLDTLKPYPVQRLQKLRGSLGIMIDDMVAALYTNIILQLLLRVNSFIAS